MQHTYNCNIAKFVSRGYSIEVKDCGCCYPTWMCVIGKDDELILLSFVPDHIYTFLHIRHKYTVSHCLDIHNKIWNMLKHEASQRPLDILHQSNIEQYKV